MPSLKNIDTLLSKLEKDNTQFLSMLDKFIKFNIALVESTEEIREELIHLNKVYQFIIHEDNEILNNFWIEIVEEKIVYQQGINEKANVRLKIAKNVLIRAIKREISLSDYYMRGLIEIDGDMYDIIKLRNVLKYLFDYLTYKYNLK